MIIESIELKDFKGISGLKIEPKRINILLGRNNTGKTSILEAIELCLNPTTTIPNQKKFMEGDLTPYLIREGQPNATIRIVTPENTFETVISHPEEEEIIAAFKEEASTTIVRAIKRIKSDTDVTPEDVSLIGRNVEVALTRDLRSEIVKNSVEIRITEGTSERKTFTGYYDQLSEIMDNEDLLTFLTKRFHFRGTEKWMFATIFAIRHRSFEQKQGDRVDRAVFLRDMLQQKPTIGMEKRYPEKINRIEKIIKEKGLLPNLERLSLKFTVLKDEVEYKVPFEFLGDGFKALITLLWHTVESKTNSPILLLDEPEAHMHPGYIKELVRYLIDKTKSTTCQIFISTHSMDVIDELINIDEEYHSYLNQELMIYKLDRLEDTAFVKATNFTDAKELRTKGALDLRGI